MQYLNSGDADAPRSTHPKSAVRTDVFRSSRQPSGSARRIGFGWRQCDVRDDQRKQHCPQGERRATTRSASLLDANAGITCCRATRPRCSGSSRPPRRPAPTSRCRAWLRSRPCVQAVCAAPLRRAGGERGGQWHPTVSAVCLQPFNRINLAVLLQIPAGSAARQLGKCAALQVSPMKPRLASVAESLHSAPHAPASLPPIIPPATSAGMARSALAASPPHTAPARWCRCLTPALPGLQATAAGRRRVRWCPRRSPALRHLPRQHPTISPAHRRPPVTSAPCPRQS